MFQLQLATAVASGTAVGAYAAVRTRNPAYVTVGFLLAGLAGLLYGDDLPHAYQRATYGKIDSMAVHSSFLSWWRQLQHEKFYAANPTQRPGATKTTATTTNAAK